MLSILCTQMAEVTLTVLSEDTPGPHLYDSFSSLRNAVRCTVLQQFTCVHAVLHSSGTAYFLALVANL
jgi:hypothetical protein